MNLMLYFFFLIAIFIRFTNSQPPEAVTRTERIIIIIHNHNILRKEHNVSDLVESEELKNYAQTRADKIAQKQELQPAQYGENRWNGALSSEDELMRVPSSNLVQLWYDEIHKYPGNYTKEALDLAGNFIRMIWKSSENIGVGISSSIEGGDINTVYVVCNYGPAATYQVDKVDDGIKLYTEQVLEPTTGWPAKGPPVDVPEPPSDAEKIRISKRKLILNAHNEYRTIHRVTNLTENSKLNDYAQERADKMAQTKNVEHTNDLSYGENIWSAPLPSESDLMEEPNSNVVKIWYDEIDKYPGEYTENMLAYTSHFTQLVWKDSERIGIGISSGSGKAHIVVPDVANANETHINETNFVYVVCNYDPKGNTEVADIYEGIKIYSEQVLPPPDGWPHGKRTGTNIAVYIYIFILAILLIGIISIVIIYYRRIQSSSRTET